MRYFIELSFNGTAYHGWQIQPNAISVQEVIEDSLNILLNSKISLVAAGRTDTGVHAINMICHFDYNSNFQYVDLINKLNSYLKQDISVNSIYRVKNNIHARFDAISREYIYKISKTKNVFGFNQSYFVKNKLDTKKMNEACKVLKKYENFKSFSKSKTDVKTYNCNILKASWKSTENEIIFQIKANRFLRNMVRAIVGTMIEIGLGKLSINDFHEIIKSKDRTKAGPSVPPHALYLKNVEYLKDIKIG